jgi:DNA-binding MarR family transcriptional regulator
VVDRLPLSTLLSQTLVAHTIEFDNEFERRFPHSATAKGGAGIKDGKPWLVSQVMWTNFLRFVGDGGTPVRDLQAMACLSDSIIKSRLHHLEWWTYISFAPDPSDRRAKPRYRDLLVHLTPGGTQACATWAPLEAEIDKRWRKRFGRTSIDRLAATLRAAAAVVAPNYPDYLPVVDYGDGMRATLVWPDEPLPRGRAPVDKLGLSALLARVLLALTLEVEKESELSLTISANVLRAIGEGGEIAFRDVPRSGGVAKEGVTAAVNFLQKRGFVSVGSDPDKITRLTEKGEEARVKHRRALAAAEKTWGKRLGPKTLALLRDELDALSPALGEGMTPHDDGWRGLKPYKELTDAFVQDPRASLPHHPMILHRGGYPDGS